MAALRDPNRKIVYAAALSLVAFCVMLTLALAAWFKVVADPWTWKSVLTLLCALGGGALAVLVWRRPSRQSVVIGIGVMVVSLFRVGGPGDWTWATFALLAVTTLLLIPLVHAAVVLR